MELAQSKALNQYSFRDQMNWLTELWQNCYERMAQIDEGFYSRTVKLTNRLTRMPPFVHNTVKVYSAIEKMGFPRRIYRASSYSDMEGTGVYHISGNDLYCPDAETGSVWVEYVPAPPFITFTLNNRDPIILDKEPEHDYPFPQRYGPYRLEHVYDQATGKHTFTMVRLSDISDKTDVTDELNGRGKGLDAVICDYPYVFVSYVDPDSKTAREPGDFSSYIIRDIMGRCEYTRFNPFDYMGRPSRVKYITAKWNDYTGKGVTVYDQDDSYEVEEPDGKGGFVKVVKYRIKELGWTPDTKMVYPSPIMRNYIVAHMAQKFADLNGSQLMAVENEVVAADYQMANFFAKDKSSWIRPERVTGHSLGDFL
jgi:hypothetical protein